MTIVNRQFVAMPDFLNLDKQNLKYLDALVYAAIRSFFNSRSGYAYPPYEQIMKRTGLGRTFISQSITRLEQQKLLTIDRSHGQGTCNRYHFGNLDRFERIPYSLFEAADLTPYQKAMLLCLRQFFNQGLLQCTYRIKEIAVQLGLSYSQVSKPLKALIAKGYIEEKVFLHKSLDKARLWMAFTDKIDWLYEYGEPKPSTRKMVLS